MDLSSYADLRALAAAWGLTQPRILAMFIAVPLFARQLMPGLLRFGLAGGIGLLAAPPLLSQLDQVPQGLALGLWVTKEACLGFVLGFVLAIPFWAFEAAGFFIDNQRGASIAATLNPLTGNDSSPLGQLFNQAFIVFVLVSGAFGLLLHRDSPGPPGPWCGPPTSRRAAAMSPWMRCPMARSTPSAWPWV